MVKYEKSYSGIFLETLTEEAFCFESWLLRELMNFIIESVCVKE